MISPSRNVVKDYEDKNKKSVLRTGAKALNFLSQRCTNVCVGSVSYTHLDVYKRQVLEEQGIGTTSYKNYTRPT